MGFIFFVIFLLIVLFVILLCLVVLTTVFFLIVGLFSLILGKTKQRKGNKTILVKLSIVFFVISFICMSVLLSFVLLLRANNRTSYDGYVDTGKILVITELEMINKGFEVDGERFVFLGDNYDSEKAKKKEAICNILSLEVGEVEQFIYHILNYNPYDTLYEIENDSGFPIYTNNSRLVCCKEKDFDKIQQFYKEESKVNYYYEDYYEVGEKGGWTVEDQKVLQGLFEKPNPQWEIKVFSETEVTGEYNVVRQSQDSIYAQRAYIFFSEEEICLWICDIEEEDLEDEKDNKEGNEEDKGSNECVNECGVEGYILDEELVNCIRKVIKE